MNIEKIKRKLGKDTVEEMDGLSDQALKDTIIQAEQSQKDARAELDKNPNYVRARNDLNALRSGLNEVNARQRAKIAYALHRLEELGKG